MPLSFVFILETVVTKLAHVLFLRFMVSKEGDNDQWWERMVGSSTTWLTSAPVTYQIF